jgi:hypothetical protein
MKRDVTIVLTMGLLIILTAIPAAADNDGARIEAHRLTQPVHMDGRLDDSAWQRPTNPPLVQNEPENGADPIESTDWWVAYDDEALYIAARLHDSEAVNSKLGRRDTWPSSDWVYVNLDTFNDDRNAFSFSVNPDGVIGDGSLYNDGWSDNSWDGVWSCATSVDSEGWSVEIRIPFSQLNFPSADTQVWGINFSRRYLRCNGREDAFHKPRDEAGYMNRFPDLVGIEGIAPGQRLEVLAFGVGKAEFVEVEDGDPFRDGSDFFGDVGADVTWGLSSNLTVNATVNPDFGQVEVDPAVVNLSDFETYFEERRPFFVRDANSYRFGREGLSGNVGFNFSDPQLFYSRRIGRAPQLPLEGHDYADAPSATTILGAAKLGGKIGNTTVGVMTAVTAEEKADLDLGGVRSRQSVEPMTSYTAARVKHTTPDGRQGVGAMMTGVWRDLATATGHERLSRHATAAGLDGWTTLDEDGVWAMRGHLSMSRVTGDPAAISRLQTSSRRYFQRPDADHIDYDPTRESLDGWAGRVMLNKQSGNFNLNTAVGAISPGYEINDMGFQYRADQLNVHLMPGYSWHEPKGWLRYRSVSMGVYKNWDFGGRSDQYGAGLFYDAQFTNYWGVFGMLFYNPERNNYRVTRGGPVMRVKRHREAELGVYTNWQRPWVVEVVGSVSDSEDGSSSTRLTADLTVRPLPSLRLSLGVRRSWEDEHYQWVDNVDDAAMTATYGVRHVFGRMDFDQLSFPVRLDWTFTPKLTLQSYVQPLFATGRYTDFKEFARGDSFDFNRYGEDGSTIVRTDDGYVVDPDGAGPIEAYDLYDPDFNFKSLKVNLVLRWEYGPGSTFYLVWTQDRVDFQNPGDFEPSRDWDLLMEAPGDDIVMAKITTWLDW